MQATCDLGQNATELRIIRNLKKTAGQTVGGGVVSGWEVRDWFERERKEAGLKKRVSQELSWILGPGNKTKAAVQIGWPFSLLADFLLATLKVKDEYWQQDWGVYNVILKKEQLCTLFLRGPIAIDNKT